MATTIAESGFIRLSDDKKFLLVTLYNGNNYQHTRSSKWYTDNALRHDKFDVQDISIPMEGFDFQRNDNNEMINGSQTKNINELQRDIDSLSKVVVDATARSYDPLMQDNIFKKDADIMTAGDSLELARVAFNDIMLLDSIAKQPLRKRNDIWNTARSEALNSRNAFSFDETLTKNSLTDLYKSKNDWHRKLALPVSVIIFFLLKIRRFCWILLRCSCFLRCSFCLNCFRRCSLKSVWSFRCFYSWMMIRCFCSLGCCCFYS